MKAYLGPIAIAVVLLSGASMKPGPAVAGGGPDGTARTVTAHPAGMTGTGVPTVAQSASGAGWPGVPASGFRASRAAALPDLGVLIGYPGHAVRKIGPYTWYRAAVSEAHALNAIGSGHLRLTTPDGRRLDFRYQRHEEHASGDWTWIGELAGRKGAQAILTIGADAVFGTIAQGDGPPLRITMRDGVAWLVKTDASAIAARDNAATRPDGSDYRLVPEAMLPRLGNPPPARVTQPGVAAGPGVAAAATTIDLLVGFTPGFLQAQGSASAAMTRLQYLVDVANTAYANGGITGRLRLVHAMQVDYTDSNSNDTALQALSGYDAGSGPIQPDPAFDGLRFAREAYGADVVSLVRDFRDPENGGCGIAWLLGGGLQGLDAGEGWDDLAFSVVGDGIDTSESDGYTYFCPDDTLVHELGHNMGAAHDRETSKGGDGTLDSPEDYGAYSYSFGYKTTPALGNFYTVMAYGDAGQTGYLTFSTPDSTFCGGNPCGQANADNVRTLGNTMPVVADFRASVSEAGGAREDFDGDGASDILWRNGVDGRNTIWLSADRSTQQDVPALTDLDWEVAATGDFDGDGEHDIFWRNAASGDNTLWYSATQARSEPLTAVAGKGWRVVGAGDFDGDGEDDILWRDQQSGKNTIWFSGHADHRQSIDPVTDTRWQVAGVGDFDGDGEDDIFWNHSGSARNSVWYSGTRDRRETMKTAASNLWKVAGVGDFDGDGRDDVLWRNTSSGRNTIWRGADGYSQQDVVRVADTDWKVEGTGDYDGDGVDDVFWRNAGTGGNVLWPAADRSRRHALPTISLAWAIVP